MLDRRVGKLEQPDGVCDVGATAAQSLRQDGGGQPEVVKQGGERSCLFDRREVLADDVLDQRELQRSGVVECVVDQRGDGRLAGELGGAPAPLAGDDLEAVRGPAGR